MVQIPPGTLGGMNEVMPSLWRNRSGSDSGPVMEREIEPEVSLPGIIEEKLLAREDRYRAGEIIQFLLHRLEGLRYDVIEFKDVDNLFNNTGLVTFE